MSSAEGERRQLTALFCDIVGSTTLAARLDPEDWHDALAVYYRAATAVIERWDGHVLKYLGDGVIACFGYPWRTTTTPSGPCTPVLPCSKPCRL